MKLARSSPTKAIAGIAIISAGGRSPAKVSDRQPAPTKAIPRGKNFVTVSLFYLTRKARQLKLGKFNALNLCAWCHAMLRAESGQMLLDDEMAQVGQHLDADLFGYFEQLEDLSESDVSVALRWLCVDRAVARHFQVAALKLVQHDTFRLIEDEEGVRATDKCPIADVAIRIDSMLSLIADIKLLSRSDDGYQAVPTTRPWYEEQVARIASSTNPQTAKVIDE